MRIIVLCLLLAQKTVLAALPVTFIDTVTYDFFQEACSLAKASEGLLFEQKTLLFEDGMIALQKEQFEELKQIFCEQQMFFYESKQIKEKLNLEDSKVCSDRLRNLKTLYMNFKNLLLIRTMNVQSLKNEYTEQLQQFFERVEALQRTAQIIQKDPYRSSFCDELSRFFLSFTIPSLK